MRGENGGCQLTDQGIAGTSPRARGKRTHRGYRGRHCRNIPACAGKTARGAVGCAFELGTSPRARGKPVKPLTIAKKAGNIPACAGKTAERGEKFIALTEHPRVRGENVVPHGEYPNPVGTSPRARGKHEQPTMSIEVHRNIPACAGKTTRLRGMSHVY